MSDRNYVAEMDARIAIATEGSGWVAAVVAAKVHAQLLESDPDLLDGWLRAMAVRMLVEALRSRERHQRSVARARAGSRAFAGAADAAEAGDLGPMVTALLAWLDGHGWHGGYQVEPASQRIVCKGCGDTVYEVAPAAAAAAA